MKIIYAEDIKSHFNIAVLLNHDLNTVDHEPFTDALIERLKELEFSEEYITLVMIRSFLDVPFIASQLAANKEYSAILAGLRYETHQTDEYLQVLSSCTHIGIHTQTPILVQGLELTPNQTVEAAVLSSARSLAERAYAVVSVIGQLT